MNEIEFQRWKEEFDVIYNSEIILGRLIKHKKISRKKAKEIKLKIKKKRYASLLASPHLEGKEDLKRKAAIQCLNDYCKFVGVTKDLAFVQS